MTRTILLSIAFLAPASGTSLTAVVYLPTYNSGGSTIVTGGLPTQLNVERSDSGGTFENAYTASASAKANLDTGTLRGKANGSNSHAGFEAVIQEQFSLIGAPTSAPVPVTFEFEVDGTGFISTLNDGTSIAVFQAFLLTDIENLNDGNPTATDAEYVYQYNWYGTGMGGFDNWISVGKADPAAGGTGSFEIVSESKGGFDVILRSTVYLDVLSSGVSRNVNLTYKIQGTAGGTMSGGGAINSFNTSQARVVLPSGYDFLSESGVFLSLPPPAAVPEPGSFVLCGLGLIAGLQFARGRHSHR